MARMANIAMTHRIIVNVGEVVLEIGIIADTVFPESVLPNAALSLSANVLQVFR